MRTWLFVASLVSGAACGGKKDDAPPAPAAKAEGMALQETATAQTVVHVFVNGAEVATVDPAKIATWPRLDALVPNESRKIGTWQLIHMISPKLETIDKPAENYRDMVPALFPGSDGTPSFGMFDPVELAKHGTPATRGDKVTQIHIKVANANGRGGNEDNASANSDPTKLVIAIKTPTGASELTGATLLAIPREQQPGGEAKGWTLKTMLDAAKISNFEKLALGDAQGTVLPIEKADISATSIPFVKLNKQGQLRVKVYKKQGDGWISAGDLRALTSITVIK